MGNFNKVMILGRLTRDPEVRYIPSGAAVCDIGLAVNRRVGGGEGSEVREEVSYIDVTLWRRQAEVAGQYLSKGREVFIEGYLSMDTWEDKNSGQKRSKLKVVCDNMQLIGGPGGGGGGGSMGGGRSQNASYGGSGGGGGYESAPSAAPQQSYDARSPAPEAPQFEPEEDDDIPF